MSPRGGARAGAGRKPRDHVSGFWHIRVPEAVQAEVADAVDYDSGETLTSFLIGAALTEARRRSRRTHSPGGDV